MDEGAGPLPGRPGPRAGVLLARVRLGVLVLALLLALLVVTVLGVVDVAGVRSQVVSAGWWGPVVWVVPAALLGAVLVPGPLLGAASGALFGPWLGAAVNLVASVLGTGVAVVLGRALGLDGARSLVPPARLRRLEAGRDRYAFSVVLVQRLAPGLPDAVSSYGFGALGFRAAPVLAATAVGSAPWALAYALLGDGLADPSSSRGAAAALAFVVAAAAGVLAAVRGRRRGQEADAGPPPPAAPTTPRA